MKKEMVKVTAKVGKIEKSKSFEYEYPENFEEAIEVDGESKAMKTYLNERKTNFQDKKRKEMVEQITKLIAEKFAEMGIEI